MPKNYVTSANDIKAALLLYYRSKRQWIAVDEFHQADIFVDTGSETMEVEIKIARHDLLKGENKKKNKHELYRLGQPSMLKRPNKYLFCVPEKLVSLALMVANNINDKYGVIAFNSEKFEKDLPDRGAFNMGDYLRMVRSAKPLHDDYNHNKRWDMAMRASAKLGAMAENEINFKLRILRLEGKIYDASDL